MLRVLRDTAALYESGNPRPWRPEDVDDYVRRLMAGIVAFEVRVSRLEGRFKLSQNKGEADRRGVLAGLEGSPLPGSLDKNREN